MSDEVIQINKLFYIIINLLFSANRWEQQQQSQYSSTFIQKELQNDTNIVSDRYAYSGVAFSATKNLTIEWCKVPDSGLIIQSDMTFYLTGPIEKLSQRGDFGKEIYENSSFQNKMKAFLINQHFKRTFTKLMLLRVLMKFKQKFQTIYKN